MGLLQYWRQIVAFFAILSIFEVTVWAINSYDQIISNPEEADETIGDIVQDGVELVASPDAIIWEIKIALISAGLTALVRFAAKLGIKL